jgi:tRNA A37 N6-isopentenylltransferase MiaA
MWDVDQHELFSKYIRASVLGSVEMDILTVEVTVQNTVHIHHHALDNRQDSQIFHIVQILETSSSVVMEKRVSRSA